MSLLLSIKIFKNSDVIGIIHVVEDIVDGLVGFNDTQANSKVEVVANEDLDGVPSALVLIYRASLFSSISI